jgi:phenylacetate-CoA ligase
MARIATARVSDYAARRAAALARGGVAAAQLEALNARWQEATQAIERYRALVAGGAAPPRFASLEEYFATVPPLTKAMIQQGGVSRTSPPPELFRITGGSTAQPMQMPAYQSEYRHSYLDPWLGRSWLGIQPSDRMFLFWGHAHLLGSGWRGRLNAAVRIAKDWVQGYERVSCYDLSEARLRAVGERLLASRAAFVLGYSHALDALARANRDRAEAFARKRFKGVIAAAEAMPMDDSVAVIESTFGARVAMEYGSVETNLIAHSAPDGLYHVFWDQYLLECDPKAGDADVHEVLVTSLYPRCTPLFRYRIGDRFALGGGRRDGPSVLTFGGVLGRSNQYVQTPYGVPLHSEVVSHIVRDNPQVAAYQFVCTPCVLYLDVVPRGGWEPRFEQGIRDKAGRVDARLAASLRIRPVRELRKSVAGKLPMVVTLPEDAP